MGTDELLGWTAQANAGPAGALPYVRAPGAEVPQFPGDGGRRGARVEPDLQQEALERDADADETQTGGLGRGPGAANDGTPARVEHAQVADDRRETRGVAGRGDHHVGRQPAAVGQQHLLAGEARHRGHRRHLAGAQRVDQTHVDDRDDPGRPRLGRQPRARGRQPVPGEVADEAALQQPVDRIDHPRRRIVHGDAQEGRGERAQLPGDDVGRRPDRQVHRRSAGLGQIGGDLGAAVAGADHEDRAAPEALRAGVGRGVQQLAAKRLPARPGRDDRLGVHPGRHHDGARGETTVPGRHLPRPPGTVDPSHLGAEARHDPVRGGILRQVVGHVVARHPAAVAARDRHAGQ